MRRLHAITLRLAAGALALAPLAALAQTDPCAGRTVCLKNPLSSASIPELVGNIIKAGMGIVGALALLVFVYGGFLWLTSGGEAGKVQQGKDAMKWAIIGLVVVFSSYALVNFVFSAIQK